MIDPIRPEDVLPDGVDSTTLDGSEVRKGSVAAFVANARRLESLPPEGVEAATLEGELRGLAPALRAVGVFEVFAPRSARVASIVADVPEATIMPSTPSS